jgi:hypothetical protein
MFPESWLTGDFPVPDSLDIEEGKRCHLFIKEKMASFPLFVV